MTGADAGDVQTITSVTGTPATTFNIAGTWQVTPATGDIVIICAPATAPEVKFPAIRVPNKSMLNGVVASPSVQNLASKVWLFTVRTEDVKNNRCLDFMAPRREFFVFGSQGTLAVDASSPGYPTVFIPQWFSQVKATCTTSNITLICPIFSAIPNQDMTFFKEDSTAFQVVVQTQGGDTFADGTSTRTLSTKGASFTIKIDKND